ncbi:MAG: helix-turn-helix domain-containing protein [Treponema sp.]|jgi:SOS-response transcriptional repressor LexA|nr:helix-turn-helix domain-containing protein [Treponema sp.]
MPKTELTTQQRNIYLFINQFRGEHGYSPSRNEIAQNVHLHLSTVRNHLLVLEKKGYITWNERIPRSITVTA